jgi:hypothetical protein
MPGLTMRLIPVSFSRAGADVDLDALGFGEPAVVTSLGEPLGHVHSDLLDVIRTDHPSWNA